MDMGYTEPEKKDFSTPSQEKAPAYPYGLRITLKEEEMKKLGFNKAPNMDDIFHLLGTSKVVEVRAVDHEGDVPSYTVELQITDLELSQKKEEKTTEQVIYGG